MTAPPLPPPVPRRRWVTVLLCSVIFLAGGVVGGGVTGVVLVRRAQDAIQHPEEMPRRIALRLKHRLDLDAAQVRDVERIFSRHQASLLEARGLMLQRAVPELDQIGSDVESVLQPDQVERWRHHYGALRRDWMPRSPHRPPRADDATRERGPRGPY